MKRTSLSEEFQFKPSRIGAAALMAAVMLPCRGEFRAKLTAPVNEGFVIPHVIQLLSVELKAVQNILPYLRCQRRGLSGALCLRDGSAK